MTSDIRFHSRSIGVKLIVVCALAVAMTVPAFFVNSLVEERTKRAADVVREISAYSGGPQTFLGPVLLVPYHYSGDASRGGGVYLIFPTTGAASVKTTTEERRRSLFKVPVFRADLKFDAAFDLTASPSALPAGATLDWERAEIVVGVSDPRGALEDATVNTGAATAVLVPAQTLSDISIGNDQKGRCRLALLAAKAAAIARPNTQFHATASLRFSGAQRLAVLAYGKTTQASAQGDWASPGFDGGFLPARRAVAKTGFTAEWSVPFIARGVRAEGPLEAISGLESTALGTSFIEVADPYQSVYRSLKYVLLLVGLVFLSYFVLEVATGKRIHPAQYLLVGVAQTIFYLLLLAAAERIGFDLAFALGGGATVTLLSTNAGWVFASRTQALRALATFTLLYLVIYLLLRAEDNALLVGAIASFVAVAVVMYLTRRIDWYSSLPTDGASQP